MCWSKQASGTLAILGLGILYKRYTAGQDWTSLVPLILYIVMEALQWKQYDTIDKCDNPENKSLSKLSYVLIWLQPIVWNWHFYMKTHEDVFKFSAVISGLILVLTMDRVFSKVIHTMPYNDKESHNVGENCTKQGKKHLYWTYNLGTAGGLEPNWLWYFVLLFMPHIYKGDQYNFTLPMIAGMLVALYVTGKSIEFTSTWCAYSIPYFLVSEVLNIVA